MAVARSRVRDREHVGVERAFDAVQRVQPLAGSRAADHQRASAEAFQIERVHRLPELEHHVVGDVDDVADRADAGGGQPVGEPLRRGSNLDLEDLRTVARAEVGRLDRHLELFGRASRGHRHVRHVQREPPDRGGFASDADMAQTVGPVRGDLEIDHRVLARLDGRHLEAAQADLAGHGLRIAGHAHEVPEPRIDDLHSGNCSRKRRSFS